MAFPKFSSFEHFQIVKIRQFDLENEGKVQRRFGYSSMTLNVVATSKRLPKIMLLSTAVIEQMHQLLFYV